MWIIRAGARETLRRPPPAPPAPGAGRPPDGGAGPRERDPRGVMRRPTFGPCSDQANNDSPIDSENPRAVAYSWILRRLKYEVPYVRRVFQAGISRRPGECRQTIGGRVPRLRH